MGVRAHVLEAACIGMRACVCVCVLSCALSPSLSCVSLGFNESGACLLYVSTYSLYGAVFW